MNKPSHQCPANSPSLHAIELCSGAPSELDASAARIDHEKQDECVRSVKRAKERITERLRRN